ncbi:MAG: hypothetical protein ABSH09_36765 [Bryobacteraceae bacterium]
MAIARRRSVAAEGNASAHIDVASSDSYSRQANEDGSRRVADVAPAIHSRLLDGVRNRQGGHSLGSISGLNRLI